jgi:elongation factor Ts
MSITAAQVAELRQLTSCGFMDCKNALTAVNGDMEKAIEFLREKGIAAAQKKASSVAAEGMTKIKMHINGQLAVMIEVNCETDFVSRDPLFQQFVDRIVEIALNHRIDQLEALSQFVVEENKTIEQWRQELVSKIGENIVIRRIALIETKGFIGIYSHHDRISVAVAVIGGDAELAKDLAMHIAASRPSYIHAQEVSSQVLDQERKIYEVQAKESGKPENIIQKMVEGRLQKFLNEVTLVGQPFVKNPDVVVQQLLKDKKATVEKFVRFELGEGIEKEKKDFAAEVMSQITK